MSETYARPLPREGKSKYHHAERLVESTLRELECRWVPRAEWSEWIVSVLEAEGVLRPGMEESC